MTKAKKLLQPIGEIGKYLKRSAWFSIAESLLLILLGVLFVAMPKNSTFVITLLAGIFFFVRGIYQIVEYFLSKSYKNFFNNNLLWGILSIILGGALFLAGDQVANLLRIIIGIWVIYSSLVHVSTAIKLSSAKIKSWAVILVMSILTLILGCVLLAYQNSAVIFIGWFLIFGGIFSVISDIVFIANIEDLQKCLEKSN